MKILAPAGNFESLKTAIYNGADEVYLGVNEFNARNNINGFTIDTLKEAVDFCHIYSVRVFLAVNILFNNDELQSALELVVKAYNIGVDAFIIQDLALAKSIKDNYPEIELHASTQMGIHNLEGVREIEKYGFSRVVLARETPLLEIKRIRENSNIEIEYFVHGALCVSFSGNCYLSSYLFNASGNRGRCKQLCRLPYTLTFNGQAVKKGYLLSAKDFNMVNRLKDIKEAGVTSLKIEGRARRPYYVGLVTREYKKALLGLEVDSKQIDLAFNREFTEGYFNGNGKIISLLQNHVGLDAGKVVKVKLGKNFNEVFIVSPIKLQPKSVLKLTDGEREITTLTAYDLKDLGSGKYLITTTQKVKENLLVRLISSQGLEEEFLSKIRKREIDITLSLKQNEPITASLNLNGKSVRVIGEVLDAPINRPILKQDIENCFNKSEYFAPNITYTNFDNVFMVKSYLNEFRREVYAKAKELLISLDRKQLKPIKIDIPKGLNLLENFSIVDKISDNYIGDTVIYSPEIYLLDDIEKFALSVRAQGKKPYLFAPNFALKEDIKLLKEIINKTKIGIVANNYYALGLTDDIIVGGGLNVYNNLTAKILDKKVIIAESDKGDNTPYYYMTLRHCPIKSHVGGGCADCKYKNGYQYVMENGKTLKLKRKKLTDCTFYLE